MDGGWSRRDSDDLLRGAGRTGRASCHPQLGRMPGGTSWDCGRCFRRKRPAKRRSASPVRLNGRRGATAFAARQWERGRRVARSGTT